VDILKDKSSTKDKRTEDEPTLGKVRVVQMTFQTARLKRSKKFGYRKSYKATNDPKEWRLEYVGWYKAMNHPKVWQKHWSKYTATPDSKV
jgi:hypothetical protein